MRNFIVLAIVACHSAPKAAPAAKKVTLTVASSGAGSVSSFPVGIACGASCTMTFTAGDSVALFATPAAGSALVSWSQSGCSNGECVVTLLADTTVTATFAPEDGLTVTLAGAGHGSVTSADGSIDCKETAGACVTHAGDGQTIALAAVADPGFFFSGWRGACSGSGACAVSVASGGSAVQAVFSAVLFWSGDNTYWSIGLGGQNPQRLTQTQNVTYQGLAAPSGDGSVMIFTSQQDPSGADAQTAVANLWALDLVNHELTALTQDQSAAMGQPVAVSSDGKSAAFLSNRATSGAETPLTASNNLWVIGTDGSGATAVTNYSGATTNIAGFSFSPDGSELAFLVNDPGPQYDVWTVASDGSGATNLTQQTESLNDGTEASWSPDGTLIAYAHDNDLYVVDTTSAHSITDLTRFTVTHDIGSLSWSADSTTLYFQSKEDPNDQTKNTNSNVWSVAVTSPYARQVLTPGAAAGLVFTDPLLAADGTLICESNASLADATTLGTTFNLWTIGGGIAPITSSSTVQDLPVQDADE